MKLIYNDGGELECERVTIGDEGLWVDDIYSVSYQKLKEIIDN